jgi:hypothetical protein
MNDSTDSGCGLLVELSLIHSFILMKELFSQEGLFHEINFTSFIILWLFKVITGNTLLYFHNTEIPHKSFIFHKNQHSSKTVVLVHSIVKLRVVWSDGLTDTQITFILSSALSFCFIM